MATAPTACAAATNSATGPMAPVTFDIPDTETIFTRESMISSSLDKSTLVVVVELEIDELGTSVLGDQLPRNDVGVVLHDGENDPVAFLQPVEPPAVCNHVYARCCSSGEHHLARGVGADEAGDLGPGALVCGCCLFGESVRPAMHV